MMAILRTRIGILKEIVISLEGKSFSLKKRLGARLADVIKHLSHKGTFKVTPPLQMWPNKAKETSFTWGNIDSPGQQLIILYFQE